MTTFRLLLLVCCTHLATAQSSIIDSLLLIDEAEVYFETGIADLDSLAATTIATFYTNSLKRRSDSIYISAHTDNVGENGNNMRLSLERAKKVRQQLVILGMKEDIIRIEEFGESQPIASNLTARGRKLNRRSVLTAFKKIRMTRLSGYLLDESTQKGIQGDVYVGSALMKTNLITDTSGYFETTVPIGAALKLRPSAYGYFMTSDTLFKPKPPVDIEVKLYLRPFLKNKKVETFLFKGQLVDSLSGHGLQGEIVMSTKGKMQQYQTQEDGSFEILLRLDQTSQLKALVRDYLPTQVTVDSVINEKTQVIRLSPLVKGSTIAFQDLVFEKNEPTLMKESKIELDNILDFMRLNTSIRVEIAGHVDDAYSPVLEETDPLHLLSVARAKTVYNYLITNEIAADRLEYKGYGNQQSLYTKPITDEEHKANRRVEIRILNED
jgi:outer membrane protein OmpA-like peptidoglycan-associated protein